MKSRLVEVLLAQTMLWGLLLLLPPETFAIPGYSVMQAVLSEPAWAIYAIASSALGFASLYSRNDFWFIVSSLMQAVLWGMVLISLFLAFPQSTATAVYLGLCVIWFRIAKVRPY